MKKSEFKQLIREIIQETSGSLDDLNYVENVIKQVYGNQPSLQDIIEYFSLEYGSQAPSKLVQSIVQKFQNNNPNFYIVLDRNKQLR